MSNNNTPPGQSAAIRQRLAQIKQLQQSITDINEGGILRAELRIVSRRGNEPLYYTFKFPPGAIPSELSDFLGVISNDLENERMQMLSDRILLVIGNNVVDLDDFIKDYTTGDEISSVSPEDIAALRALLPSQHIIIKINDEPVAVRRF